MTRAVSRVRVVVLGAVVAGLGACAALEPGSVTPSTGSAARSDPVVRDVVMDGTPWRVLVAGAEGMRGRSDFAGADGMLFDLGRDVGPGAVAFVMDGVPIALDIAWFAGDGSLVGRARMEPCAAEPCPRSVAPAPFRYAIEALPGAFDELAPDAILRIAP